MNISNLIVGGMIMTSGAFAYWWMRNRRDLLRGLTYRQFVWCCVGAIIAGAICAFAQFFIEP